MHLTFAMLTCNVVHKLEDFFPGLIKRSPLPRGGMGVDDLNILFTSKNAYENDKKVPHYISNLF